MQNPILSFSEFINEHAVASTPIMRSFGKAPTFMELINEFHRVDEFLRMESIKIGDSTLVIYKQANSGFPLANLFHKDNSIHLIYDRKLKRKSDSLNSFSNKSKLSYNFTWMFNIREEGFGMADMSKDLYIDIQATEQTKTLYNHGRINTRRNDLAVLSDPAIRSVLMKHFSSAADLIALNLSYYYRSYMCVPLTDEMLKEQPHIQKLFDYGFEILSNRTRPTDEVSLTLKKKWVKVKPESWLHFGKKDYPAFVINLTRRGIFEFSDFEGNERAPLGQRTLGICVTEKDWDTLAAYALSDFLKLAERAKPEIEVINYAEHPELRDQMRIDDATSDTINDLW